MTNDDTARPGTAWEPRPGPRVTLLAAEPGAIRTDTNGTQWHLDAAHGWQPVSCPSPGPSRPARRHPEPKAELEAGQ